ncbi:MAG: ABZJ_00895 family protein [Pseudomonadota bacterium]
MQRLILRDFAIGYAAALVALILLSLLLATLFDYELGSSGSIGVVIAAAVYAAARHAARGGERPGGLLAWELALWMTLIAAAIGMIPMLLLALFVGLNPGAGIGNAGVGVFFIAFVIVGGLNVLLLRFLFPWFVSLQIRAREKRASRG